MVFMVTSQQVAPSQQHHQTSITNTVSYITADSQEYDLYRQSELVWELCQALWGNLEDPLIEGT